MENQFVRLTKNERSTLNERGRHSQISAEKSGSSRTLREATRMAPLQQAVEAIEAYDNLLQSGRRAPPRGVRDEPQRRSMRLIKQVSLKLAKTNNK